MEIFINDHEHGDTIAKAVKTYYNPKYNTCIAREKAGELLGGAIYTHYTGESIQMHLAGFRRRWANRDLVFAVFDYPFNQLGVKRIFGFVPEDNWHAQKLNMRAGFRVVARLEGMFKHNIACVVMCMERAECRFLDTKPRSIKSNLD